MLKDHKIVTVMAGHYLVDCISFYTYRYYCEVCKKTLEEIEKEESPQNPEYRFKHLSEEPVG